MPKDSIRKVSVSAMKADSIVKGSQKHPNDITKHSMRVLILTLLKNYPNCHVCFKF